eukprot:GHVU01173658.1.p1 GENE.GHVU01173658.1~~GHVU01173658.1.p1  ORF type:complete len:461 (+),score=38.28 GHVU01173658.1:386-1768(+)
MLPGETTNGCLGSAVAAAGRQHSQFPSSSVPPNTMHTNASPSSAVRRLGFPSPRSGGPFDFQPDTPVKATTPAAAAAGGRTLPLSLESAQFRAHSVYDVGTLHEQSSSRVHIICPSSSLLLQTVTVPSGAALSAGWKVDPVTSAIASPGGTSAASRAGGGAYSALAKEVGRSFRLQQQGGADNSSSSAGYQHGAAAMAGVGGISALEWHRWSLCFAVVSSHRILFYSSLNPFNQSICFTLTHVTDLPTPARANPCALWLGDAFLVESPAASPGTAGGPTATATRFANAGSTSLSTPGAAVPIGSSYAGAAAGGALGPAGTPGGPGGAWGGKTAGSGFYLYACTFDYDARPPAATAAGTSSLPSPAEQRPGRPAQGPALLRREKVNIAQGPVSLSATPRLTACSPKPVVSNWRGAVPGDDPSMCVTAAIPSPGALAVSSSSASLCMWYIYAPMPGGRVRVR